jgi:hypothetical protein
MPKNSKKKTAWQLVYQGNQKGFSDAASAAYWREMSVEEKFRLTQALIEEAEMLDPVLAERKELKVALLRPGLYKNRLNGSELLRSTAVIKWQKG